MAEKGNLETRFTSFCRRLGKGYRGEASEELRFAVEFLGWDISPAMVVGAARAAMFISFAALLAALLLALWAGANPLPAVFALPISVALFLLITEWPKSLARQKAVDALSHAPYIIAQACVSLKQMPNMENALSFVAEYGEGMIARDIRHMLWHMWSGKESSPYEGITRLADKWGRFSKGFTRSVYLIRSSFFERTVQGKLDTLDKAIDVMLDDVITRMREYAMALHVPTLVLFSMGTIVPLMVISLFPIVSLFGFEISPATITMFLVLSLVGCFIYSTMVLKKRPSTLSLPGAESKEEREQSRYAGSLAIASAVILSFPSVLYLVSLTGVAALYGPVLWLAENLGGFGLVWGVGLGVSVYAYMTSSTRKGHRKKVRELEEQFIDALYHIKNRLSDGRPLERALEFAAGTLGDLPVSVYIRGVLNRMKRKSVTLETALKEEETDSGMIRFVFRMLLNSLKGGRKAASQTASVIYEYVTKIQKIEKEMNTLLSKPLSMMKATVLFFAPLVCGIIVVLFQMITKTIEKSGRESLGGYGMEGVFIAPMINPMTLQLIVGLYTIALNYVLLRYVSRIQSGSDSIAFRADMARAIPITLIIFTATLLTASMVLLR